MLHQQSLLQTRLHHNVKNLWLSGKNENKNSLSSGPIAAFKKIPFAPMEAVAGSFIQIPPLGDLVKAAAAIGPGAGEWSKTKHVKNQRSTKIRRLQGRNKKWIFDLFLHGNYIEDIFPMKK
jgi:hypothetical protein